MKAKYLYFILQNVLHYLIKEKYKVELEILF